MKTKNRNKKNTKPYAERLRQEKEKRQQQDVLDGITFGLNLVTVALNNLFGFGPQRLKRIETECNRLMDEEFIQDFEHASYDLIRRVEQIRKDGKAWTAVKRSE